MNHELTHWVWVRGWRLWSWHPETGRVSARSCHGPSRRASGSFLLPPTTQDDAHTNTHTLLVNLKPCWHENKKFNYNWILIEGLYNTTRNTRHFKKVHPSLILFQLWPVVLFAEGGLVCTGAFPFPASAAVPSQGCQGSSSGLQHKINRKATFWLLRKSSHGGQNMTAMTYLWGKLVQTLRSFLFSLPSSNLWWWTMELKKKKKKKFLIDKQELSIQETQIW